MNEKSKKQNKPDSFGRTIEKKFIEEINDLEKEEQEKREARKQREILAKVPNQRMKKELVKHNASNKFQNTRLKISQFFSALISSLKKFLRAIFHPKTIAQLALAVTIFILIVSFSVVIFAKIQAENFVLPSAARKSILEQSGEAQLLDSFGKSTIIPENPLSIRLDGLLISQDSASYATVTVDGITATVIANDYIGPYRVDEISVSGIILKRGSESITLDFSNNKYEVSKD